MKTMILKLSVFVLIFTLMGAGCEKEKKYEDIPLEYIKCPCNNDTSFTRKITIQDVLLFDASKTSENEMRSLSFDGEKSQFISYHKDTKSALLCIIRVSMEYISDICNFPATINALEIPLTGETVSLNADIFEPCTPKAHTTYSSYSNNCVLTSLKRRIK